MWAITIPHVKKQNMPVPFSLNVSFKLFENLLRLSIPCLTYPARVLVGLHQAGPTVLTNPPPCFLHSNHYTLSKSPGSETNTIFSPPCHLLAV